MHVHFFVVDVGDLVEHGVQVAGLLADVDHVDHHVVHQPALLQRLGDGFALADRFVDALVHALEDRVGARLADDRSAPPGSARRRLTSVPSVRMVRATIVFSISGPTIGIQR